MNTLDSFISIKLDFYIAKTVTVYTEYFTLRCNVSICDISVIYNVYCFKRVCNIAQKCDLLPHFILYYTMMKLITNRPWQFYFLCIVILWCPSHPHI